MASMRKETRINARPEDVWDALRDWGALHTRLVPGFVVDTRLDGGRQDRHLLQREHGARGARRSRRRGPPLVWSIVGGPYAHHNGSAQVLAEGDGRTRFVWITDLLPNELAGRTSELMERGIRVLKETMEAGSAS